MNLERRFVLGLAWLVVTGVTKATTVLEYPPLAHDGLIAVSQVQASSFHDWPAVHRQAEGIVQQWESEVPTLAWTRIQLDLYVKHKMMPTRGARGLALMHVAMHDAYELAQAGGQDERLAISMAAAQVLGYLFVAEERAFDRLSFAVAAKLTGQPMTALPHGAMQSLQLGYEVGQSVVRHAEADGAQRGWNGLRLQYYGEGRYYGPGAWEPTPPYFYFPPDEPFAPQWRPWMLSAPSEFRPTPPAYGSPRYLRDVKEVIDIAGQLTPEQLAVAKFWVDGHGSVTPPGHWNRIAIDEVKREKLSAAATARLFAQLNVAQADTFLAVWDCKYHYWTARPITVAKPLFGVDLKTAVLTPPFPSYVSGHAAFSGAAARVLANAFPARSDILNGMAEEAAHSRLVGGIHFRHDNEDGLTLGRKVADKVLASPRWESKD